MTVIKIMRIVKKRKIEIRKGVGRSNCNRQKDSYKS